MKIIWSVIVVAVWAFLMIGNLAGAGRTAAQMQLRDGLSEREAQRKATTLVFVWTVVISVIAIVLFVVIW